MRKIYIAFLLACLSLSFVACEDNIDKENPMIGKWRLDNYVGDITTSDSLASIAIRKSIDAAYDAKNPILMYQFMSDSSFILYNLNTSSKLIGTYLSTTDSLFFQEPTKKYSAVKDEEKYFSIPLQNVTSAYTLDSLSNLGVVNPEAVNVEKVVIIARYKRV